MEVKSGDLLIHHCEKNNDCGLLWRVIYILRKTAIILHIDKDGPESDYPIVYDYSSKTYTEFQKFISQNCSSKHYSVY